MWPAPNITLLEDTQHQRQDQTKLIWLGNSSKWTRKRSKHRLCKENKRHPLKQPKLLPSLLHPHQGPKLRLRLQVRKKEKQCLLPQFFGYRKSQECRLSGQNRRNRSG